ncbi:MAG: aldehyde dehydrogenase family protein, partial [bacterium]
LEETFGPVAAFTSFVDDEQAFRYADAGVFGLAGAVFSRNVGRALRFAEQLRLGVVNINDHSSYWDRRSPAGGASGKRSGIGRLGGKYALLEMTDLKTITIDIGANAD